MKNTATMLSDRIIARMSAALEAISQHKLTTGADDDAEAVELLEDRLEACVKEARAALMETAGMREIYEEIK